MREIGVRQLKATLSEVLRSVGSGEQVRVTVRGRAIADIVPAVPSREDNEIRALVSEGRITPPARSRGRRPPRLARANQLASELILADRDAERR